MSDKVDVSKIVEYRPDNRRLIITVRQKGKETVTQLSRIRFRRAPSVVFANPKKNLPDYVRAPLLRRFVSSSAASPDMLAALCVLPVSSKPPTTREPCGIARHEW
jgi:hypothetical protein